MNSRYADYTDDGLIMLDEQSRIVDLNPAALRILGFDSRSPAINQPAVEVLSRLGHDLTAHLDAETEDQTELTLEKPGGREHYIVQVVPLYEHDRLTGRMLILADITERRRAEEALHHSEARFRMLLDIIGEGILIHEQGRFVVVNRALAEMLGYRVEAMIGKDALNFLLPEYRGQAQKSLHRANPQAIEVKAVRADGSVFPVRAIGKNISYHQERVIQIISVQDLTAQKRAERKLAEERNLLRTLLDNLPESIYIKDTEGRFLFYNERARRDFEPYVQEEIIGKTDVEIFSPDLVAQWPKNWYEAERAVVEDEVTYIQEVKTTRDDKEQWTLIHKSPLRNARGQIIGLVGINRDITERKLAEAERERLIVELDAFAHTVAHDLKNPLSGVTGYVGVLLEEWEHKPDSYDYQLLRAIERHSHKINNIITELLLLASIHASEVELVPLNMVWVINEAKERLRLMIEEYEAEFILPDTWPTVLGYAPWIEEIWANYISNAIKYGGTPPCVEMGATELGNDKVRLWVRDNGAGIPPEAQKQLFTEFTRLAQTRAKGHGLGLSIVQRIVQKLGGKAGLESTVGQGSTFWFTLPRAPDQGTEIYD